MGLCVNDLYRFWRVLFNPTNNLNSNTFRLDTSEWRCHGVNYVLQLSSTLFNYHVSKNRCFYNKNILKSQRFQNKKGNGWKTQRLTRRLWQEYFSFSPQKNATMNKNLLQVDTKVDQEHYTEFLYKVMLKRFLKY